MTDIRNVPIERITKISASRFRHEYIEMSRPLIISGGVDDWPAIKSWTDPYLIENAGEMSLRVRPKVDYVDGKSMREIEPEGDYSLKTVLALISSDQSPDLSYARESNLLSRCPGLRNDINTPAYFSEATPYALPRTGSLLPKIWLGPANTIAQLHWDPEHNLFAQVRGQKRVILVPPDDAPLTSPNLFSVNDLALKPFFEAHKGVLDSLLKCSNAVSSLALDHRQGAFRKMVGRNLNETELSIICDFLLDVNNCHVDAENPDFTLFPAFSKARRFEAILSPGDLLFIPFFWLHYLRSLSPSISINWFFLQEDLLKSVTSDQQLDILLAHLIP